MDARFHAFLLKQGEHYAQPWQWSILNDKDPISWVVRFGPDCAYDLKDEDQDDWNKLLGIYYNVLDPHDNTAMVGWRWSTESQQMEMNAYFHIDGKRVFSKPLLMLPLGETLNIDIMVDHIRKRYLISLERMSDGEKTSYSQPFTHAMCDPYEVNMYFGGNEPAPHDMHIFKAILD